MIDLDWEAPGGIWRRLRDTRCVKSLYTIVGT